MKFEPALNPTKASLRLIVKYLVKNFLVKLKKLFVLHISLEFALLIVNFKNLKAESDLYSLVSIGNIFLEDVSRVFFKYVCSYKYRKRRNNFLFEHLPNLTSLIVCCL